MKDICKAERDAEHDHMLDDVVKLLRRPGGNAGLHPYHQTADFIEQARKDGRL